MPTWYLAFCVQCNGGIENLVAADEHVLPMPFSDPKDRYTWVEAHIEGTDHSVLLLNQRTPS
jgi:hypothetical protein